MDPSAAAFEVAREWLGDQAQRVTWLVDDVTQATLPKHHYDIWHDRAVLHFLISPAQRAPMCQQ
jgi:hypothetical protein